MKGTKPPLSYLCYWSKWRQNTISYSLSLAQSVSSLCYWHCCYMTTTMKWSSAECDPNPVSLSTNIMSFSVHSNVKESEVLKTGIWGMHVLSQCALFCILRWSDPPVTRKPCYRKDDPRCAQYMGALKSIESSQTPPATFPEICKGFLFRSILRMCIQNLRFVALSVPEIMGVFKKFGQSLYTPTLQFLPNF